MDSVLDSAYLADSPAVLRRRWLDPWVRALDSVVLLGLGTHPGRRRLLSLDRKRLALALCAAFVGAAVLAAGYSWRLQSQRVEQAAQLAAGWVDERLDAVASDLQRLAASNEDQEPASSESCPHRLVEQLLDASINSDVVRRFERAKSGQILRCGPQGLRIAEAVTSEAHAGLSLILGSQIDIRPVLAYSQHDGTSFRAELEERALNLPSTLWPSQLAAADIGVSLLSAGGVALAVWGARISPQHDRLLALPSAQVSSSKHKLGVHVQSQSRSLLSLLALPALGSALGAAIVVLMAAALVWRRAVMRSRLIHRLAAALRRRQFEPFIQPIVDLTSGRCVGGEILMRWNHPQRGIVGPGEFIEEAERTGLIIGMSELTMRLAAHRLSALALANPSLYFSFNVTPGQLREPGFARQLADIFRPDTLPRQQVLLEVTERDFVDARAKATLLVLKADGWRIAIDDFGTGQSSLASIERLALDRIKIDRVFVSAIEEMTVNRPVLDAIINLARDLRVPLIAEGVETQTQWDYLAKRGVAYAQGYLMARPMPIAELLRWLPANQVQPACLPNSEIPSKTGPCSDLAEAEATPAGSDEAGPGQRHPASPHKAIAPLAEVSQAQRDLWRSMGAVGGLDVKDRSYRMRIWPACFIGSEAVDWLVSHLRVSRNEAVRCGRAMLAVGLIRHVASEHDFEDKAYFYSLATNPFSNESSADSEVFALKKSLQSAADFPWRTHSRGLLQHQRCATGREIVDWIVKQKPMSRSKAALVAAQIMRLATLRHVYDDQPFKDDRNLYRLG